MFSRRGETVAQGERDEGVRRPVRTRQRRVEDFEEEREKEQTIKVKSV